MGEWGINGRAMRAPTPFTAGKLLPPPAQTPSTTCGWSPSLEEGGLGGGLRALSKSLIQLRVQGRNPARFNGGYGVPRGFKGEKSKSPPNPLGLAERVHSFHRCGRSPSIEEGGLGEGNRELAECRRARDARLLLPPSADGPPPSRREVWGIRRSRPTALPSIGYRGFAVAPMTLRAPSRRVVITSGINGRAMRAPTVYGGATDSCKYI